MMIIITIVKSYVMYVYLERIQMINNNKIISG